MKTVIERTDCVYTFDIVEPRLIGWLVLGNQDAVDPNGVSLAPPPENAPAVAVLDTGLADAHPLLAAAVRSTTSGVPGDASPGDVHGHGTQMAGVVLYGDALPQVLQQSGHQASLWLESGRILTAPQQGSAAENQRPYWPATTQVAIEKLEAENPSERRVFCLAVTAENDFAGSPTSWSTGLDELVFDGHRLIFVSVGNAETTTALVDGYPRAALATNLMDPAQASNAVAVGACTDWLTMPPDEAYANYSPIAPLGGVSPHSRSGVLGAMTKPRSCSREGTSSPMEYSRRLPRPRATSRPATML